jgi:neutral ceramidase
MHPTVLHEDSTLVSGDFPGLARQQLQREVLGVNCPVLYHTGPAGNQSPRHVTRSNSFEEAERLGRIISGAASRAMKSIEYRAEIELRASSSAVALPLRGFATEADAQAKLEIAESRLAQLRASSAARTATRTAEVDWFGAQETLTLARAAASGRVQAAADSCMPAEVQVIRIGDWNFVAWPGEMFIEFALDVKRQSPSTFVISYANGELQGYLVTRAAAEEGGYESSNAIFKSPESGEMIVNETLKLLRQQ